MTGRIRTWLTLVLAVLAAWSSALVTPAAAQRPDLFFDTVDVNVVNVEVLVTDRDGRPVTGLPREAFRLFEDGEEVEISNFFEVADGRVAGVAEPGPAVEAPGLVPRPETDRLQLVVLVDERNIRPESRNQVFANLRSYLQTELSPSDRVMLVRLSDTLEIAASFTSDPVRLLAAVAEMEQRVGRHVELDTDYRVLMRRLQGASTAPQDLGAGPENPFAFQAAVTEARQLAREVETLAEKRYRNVRATTGLLTEFTRTLTGLRGRKAVLYVSDGLPVRAAESLVEAWIGRYQNWILEQEIAVLDRELSALTTRSMGFDASSELRRLVAAAGAHGVAFYPISAPVRGRGRSIISAETLGSGGSASGPGSLDVAVMESLNLEDSLLRLADGTGGLAYTRSANIGGLLEQVRQDFTNFYSLGFTRPPVEEGGEEMHEIGVEVLREGLEVRHLGRYQDRQPLDRLEDRMLSALHYGLEDNRLEVRLEPGAEVATGKKTYEVEVMVKIPFQMLLLLPQEDSHAAELTLLVAARDERGGVSPTQRIDFPIRIPNERMAEVLSGAGGYPMRMKMQPGWKRIAVGVRDNLAMVDATTMVEVEVGRTADREPGRAPGS